MERLLQTDWSPLFRLEMSLPEILVRGTLVYIALCLLLRIVLKRQAGRVSLSDLLVVSLVAGICRNPLVRNAYSIPDGIAVVAVVLAWSYGLDWLSYHSSLAHRLIHPKPVVLIREGRVLADNLRRELMTESQLRSQLRKRGVRDPAEVAEAILEASGQVSVIKKLSCQEADTWPEVATGPATDPSELRRATGRLREILAWHERQIATHQQAMADINNLLKSRGVRGERKANEKE
jgi:uncharacterized membrane protein YcaP (DUF421 family)